MPELFPQQLKANFTPEQQDYYAQLQREEQKILNGQTVEELVAKNEPQILEKLVAIRQEMLNFVLTKKTREMTRQEEEERERQSISLDKIERKQEEGEELTDNELNFLYLIDGFGLEVLGDSQQEGRVRRIIRQLNTKEKLAELFICEEDKISLDVDEFCAEWDIMYHFGNLDLEDLTSLPEDYAFPAVVNGFMNLSWLQILPADVLLPEVINGYFSLPNIKVWPMGVEFPEAINGDFDLSGLESLPDGACFPRFVGGDLALESITSMPKNIKLPQSLKGTLYLSSLLTVDGLDLSNGIKSVHFRDLPDYEFEKIKKKYPHITMTKAV